jgi:hypothetical protein
VITDGVTGDAACGDLAPTSLSPPADRGARLAEAKRVSLVNLVFLAFLLAQVAVEGGLWSLAAVGGGEESCWR